MASRLDAPAACAVDDRAAHADGRRLAANSLWNVVGQVGPALAGLFCTPVIVRGLGPERFGLLTIAWLIIGYFSLFDLGLGRAVTKVVAERLASCAPDLRRVLWTANLILLALGVFGAALMAASVPWLFAHVMRVAPGIEPDARRAFFLLALAIPAVVMSTAWRGVLEAAQRFDLANAVRVPLGVATYALPVLALAGAPSLTITVGLLLLARVAAAAALAVLAARVVGGMGRPHPPERALARELVQFGAWITVSNVVSPLMVTFDRFFISSAVSVAAVTYYAAPFQGVSQLLVVPYAVAAVLFPAFAAAFAVGPDRVRRLYDNGMTVTVALLVPAALAAVALAPEVLRLWLGPAFELRSTTVTRWLAAGILANGLAQVPFAVIQAAGRADITAKLHLVEAPIYAVLLITLGRAFGIDGVAVAWCARATMDLALLLAMAAPVLDRPRAAPLRLLPPAAAGAAALGLCALPGTVAGRSGVAALLIGAWLAGVWRFGLSPTQRARVRGLRLRDSLVDA